MPEDHPLAELRARGAGELPRYPWFDLRLAADEPFNVQLPGAALPPPNREPSL